MSYRFLQNRLLVKYITDLMSKMMPSRSADSKGKGLKYPLLAIEALKLTLKSADGVGHVLLIDPQLDSLNNTVQVSACEPAVAKP